MMCRFVKGVGVSVGFEQAVVSYAGKEHTSSGLNKIRAIKQVLLKRGNQLLL